MATTLAERNLLLGILAVQVRFVRREDLIDVMTAWSGDRAKPLGELLTARGAMKREHRELMETLVDEHLKLHGDDALRELASVDSPSSIEASIAAWIEDPDIRATLVAARPTQPAEQPRNAGANTTIHSKPTADQPTAAVKALGGRFQILRPHAEGGLGAVSVALDTELNREVALKQIKPAAAERADYRARFVLEAEITGALEHPGIVPVYSLGHDAAGQPFYAMRFIRGESLAGAIAVFHGRWQSGHSKGDDRTSGTQVLSSSRDLEFRSLIRRFIDVCNAISYAHSRGVLHRDLKPGNIMLGKYGETLVVDWGLAKPAGHVDAVAALDIETALRPASASATPDTLPGSAIGTPQYMPPEQAAGRLELIGPRSDVYSLGATLYAILTGRPPIDGKDVGEVLRKAQRGDFRPPRAEDSSIPRPLEAICLKAMATRPEDRYDSAGALAVEIERWLADEPVQAYQESWEERSRRWARKHRTLTTSAAAVLLVAVLGSIAFATTLTAKNRALNVERTRAEDREQLAIDAVKRYGDVVRDTPELKNAPGLASLRATLLKEPRTFFMRLRERLQADRQTTPQSLARLAAASYNLGQLTNEIGDRQDALRAHEEALATRQRLAREHSSNTDFQFALAESYHAIGSVQSEMGRPGEARVAYERARGVGERLARENPSVTRFKSDLAWTYIAIGNLELAEGRREEALGSHKQARTIWERLARANPADSQFQADLASSYYSVGMMESSTDRPAEAQASFDEALKIRERLARENPRNTRFQTDLADSLNIAGNLLNDADRLSEAMAFRQRARTIYERLARENPSATGFQFTLAQTLNNLGGSQHALDHAAEARESFEQARTIAERLVREHPESPSYADNLGMILGNLAEMDLDEERFDRARETLERAIAAGRKALAASPDHPWYRYFLDRHLSDMIRAAEGLGRGDEAERARRELDELRGSDPWNRASDARLEAVLKGQAPKDDTERRRLADLAQLKALYAASARLLAETLAHNLKLADDPPDSNRYNAACYAALAGCGCGRDAPAEAERTKLRSQARVWLETELAACDRLVDKSPDDRARAEMTRTLNHWRRDPDLYNVRNSSALTRLPEAERAAWTALWGRVDATLARMKGAKPAVAQ